MAVNDLSSPFSLFQREGGIYGIRKGKDKLKKFIPNSPATGLNNAFGNEDPLLRNKRKRGRPKKIQQEMGSYF